MMLYTKHVAPGRAQIYPNDLNSKQNYILFWLLATELTDRNFGCLPGAVVVLVIDNWELRFI
jgi:hypothetical protein